MGVRQSIAYPPRALRAGGFADLMPRKARRRRYAIEASCGDPRRQTFELTSGGGQHGQGVDDWGRKFLCSNVYPMQQLAYDARYVQRNQFMTARAPAVDINADGDRSRLFRISPHEKWRSEPVAESGCRQPQRRGRTTRRAIHLLQRKLRFIGVTIGRHRFAAICLLAKSPTISCIAPG